MNPSSDPLPIRHRRSPARNSGFTLTELMVVLVLIAVTTALIIPEMKGTFEDALLRSTARELVGALKLAYSQSVSLGRPHRFRVDYQTGAYSLERAAAEGDTTPGYLPVPNLPGSRGKLDPRIQIQIRPAQAGPADEPSPEPVDESEFTGPESGPPNSIQFFPDGTAEPKEIRLRDREGFELILAIHPATARIRILNPAAAADAP